ncbi:MAG: AMP-binding protein [Rhodomicrobium sp.]
MAELAEALIHQAATAGSAVAMSDAECSLTRSQIVRLVAGAAEDLRRAPQTIGLYGSNSVDWAIGFLALSISGKTIVPIPTFFSKEQHEHLIHDSGVEHILVTDAKGPEAGLFPVPVHSLFRKEANSLRVQGSGGGLIIYTSGSTGTPKGVRLASGQEEWVARNLSKAIDANREDKYLSVLPLPMLLELICGIMVPIFVGGTVHYDNAVAQSIGTGVPADVAEAFARAKPTASVLVPQLLALYCAQLAGSGTRPPETLRFVAVGGAAVPPALSKTARQLGLPVFEGYGLSECASVVAVNTPGESRDATVGKPLPGVHVTIEDGEIVVQGSSVMDGYLHGDTAPRRWRTGDAGSLDADGFLTVYGRRDNLIVTPYGRNISPEWIETMLLGDSRIGGCIVHQLEGLEGLTALLIPSPFGEAWFKTASNDEILALVSDACLPAPYYAQPKRAVAISRKDALARKLFTPNGRVHRGQAQKYLKEQAQTLKVEA